MKKKTKNKKTNQSALTYLMKIKHFCKVLIFVCFIEFLKIKCVAIFIQKYLNYHFWSIQLWCPLFLVQLKINLKKEEKNIFENKYKGSLDLISENYFVTQECAV